MEKVMIWLAAADPLNLPVEVSIVRALVDPEAMSNIVEVQP